ncbi:hypothetical protein VHEMI03594 [[Torrubiella] hemipterigena]|uniref:FAD/NAD(P)-binding domain-containing protein n=1 Tax=[Torrubiella] hemipterigena TaxID=1531966 RepID=A0A0A1TBN1_9HYPO|nr:hypothetical protein VHEMI03594 [[Torrubiella] hemipterigena]
MAKTVVVIGGSLAGLSITHQLLKYSLPRHKDLKVILISRNSHFYWVPGAVRAVVPGQVKDEELIRPIEPGLKQYPAGSVDFIAADATNVNFDDQTVQISTEDTTKEIAYDYLVLATGSRQADPSTPWKASGSYEELVTSLHTTAESIQKASHIVIAGGGSTGVEVAAEIRYQFKDKEVVLLSASDALVGGDSTATSVESELKKLGVVVRKGVKAVSTEPAATGQTTVVLSNGESLVTDFYLPTTGLLPNTDFLPTNVLTETKYADVDDFFQLKQHKNVWAAGDIVSRPRAGFLYTEAQATGVAQNIKLVLDGQSQKPVRGPFADVLVFAMGKSRGVGRIGPVPVPSLGVWVAKARTLGMERTKKYVDGSLW